MDFSEKIKTTEISDESYEKAKTAAETMYKRLAKIPCPYFKEDVSFDARGWEHLRFKDWNKARLRHDQYVRFKILPYVPGILSKSHTVQGIAEKNDFERVKQRGSWVQVQKRVIYYEFMAVVGKMRLKVIVKEIAGGGKFFWSVIPFWTIGKDGKQLHSSNFRD